MLLVFYVLDINECKLGTDLCAHNCTDTYGSYRCSCLTGYASASDGISCTGNIIGYTKSFFGKLPYAIFLHLSLDIDECTAGTATCSQVCHNTMGSYGCGCRPGYALDTNQRTCIGMRLHQGTLLTFEV